MSEFQTISSRPPLKQYENDVDVKKIGGTVVPASVVDTTNNAIRVNNVGGGGGGTQYNEDAAHSSGDTGTMALGVRKDTPVDLSGADGDYEPFQISGGRLWASVKIDTSLPAGSNAIGKLAANSGVDIGDVDVVSVIPGTGATNLGKAVDSAQGGTDTGVPPLAVRDDALAALTPIEGDYVPLRTDANGALWTHDDALDAALAGSELQVDIVASLPAGNNAIGKLAANDGVDIGNVDVASLPAGNLGQQLKAASLSVAPATDITDATYIGDIKFGEGLPANSGVDIGDITVNNAAGASAVNVQDGGNSLTVDGGVNASGDVAHDAADSGNPVKVGGKAYNQDGSEPGTAVAEGDRTNLITDVYGRQFVETAHPNLFSVSADYAAAQTNASIKAAPGAGLSLYITDILISNGATAGNITLLNGSGGTVLLELYPAINGGGVMNLRTPIKLSANTALVITSTTVTTHSVTISGFIAP